MKFRTLIRRSLRFHWRSHLGVVLGAAIGSAALIGALVVGDSVRGSLRERALESLGLMAYVLAPSDRFFTEKLADKIHTPVFTNTLGNRITGWPSSSGKPANFYWPDPAVTLVLAGLAVSENGEARANHVSVIGVAPYEEWDGGRTMFAAFVNERESKGVPPDEVWLNESLARQLNASVGERILLRVQKPTVLSSESAIANRSDNYFSMRLNVTRIISTSQGGNLSFRTGVQSVLNAFVNLKQLQHESKLAGRANQLVLGPMQTSDGIEKGKFWRRIPYRVHAFVPDFLRWAKFSDVPADFAVARAAEMLRWGWSLTDAEAELRMPANPSQASLVSRRVFLDLPLGYAALATNLNAQPILTYLATLLRAGTNATPYSMVTAAGAPWTPSDMRDDEIIVSQWFAEDLHAKPGDEIALSYFLPESGAKLEEATNTFRVRSIVPMELPWADRTLMPDFPGIENAESTSEWDAGFPLTHKVRPKDDEYWKQHRGTPKAFITLAAGQKMWGNRFGNLTAIRFPIPTDASPEDYRASLEKKILANLKPEELGLRFEPVREQALKAAEESQDFGGLFLGFSFFVIVAALLLMAMLFRLGLEQRAPEIGTLLALGFTPRQVRRLLLWEGVALALLGGIVGTLGGLGYAHAMIQGLTTIWRDAVGASALSFHFTAQTLIIGLFASVIVSAVTIWLSLRKFVKRPARELLVGETQDERTKSRSRGNLIGTAALLCALGIAGWTFWSGETNNAESFFSAGSLVLVAGLAFASATLTRMAVGHGAQKHVGGGFSFVSLAIRGCARRRKRSLATVAMLACGSFLILSIGVFRLDANRDATQRSSGTGGFALIGQTTMPVVQDLDSQSGREFFALNERDLAGVSFVPFRVREGDEASCLNLNAAQKPKLLGLPHGMLAGRFRFAKLADQTMEASPWDALPHDAFYPMYGVPLATNEIAAIGDANSIQWAMHKKVGDTIDYVDERGQPFKVRIVGAVANSILQGQLIIDEAEFVRRFPSESGYRTFLIDAPSNQVSQVSATLSRAMQDMGLELTPAAQRLAQFNAVQNTYLGTFQVLGGLGMLLGSVGLGIVVMRNVLERRGELALLMAVGFRKPQVQRLLLMENAALLAAGLVLGVIAAGVAVMPALLSPEAQLPVTSLAVTLSAVLINGAIWTWAASRLALRGDLLAALRNE